MIEVRELTPGGRGGVTVLQVAGEGALERVRGLLAGDPPPAGVPGLARLTTAGGTLDEALVLVRGAAEVELHVHGSPPVVRSLLRAIAGAAPPAPRNAEERAALLAGRAGGEAAARMLLDQAGGALRRELDRLALREPAAWRAGLERLLDRARVAARLVEPPRVVLAGPVNAGKSTLFNALVGRERVVTGDEEGTTRDVIAERVLLGAYEVELLDTAGERATAAAVERAGQDAGRTARADADLVVHLRPPGAEAPPGGAVTLAARGDLAPDAGGLRPLEDPSGARRVVEAAFLAALDLPADPWTPGAGVPFDAELANGLRAALPLRAAQARRLAVASLLGPRSLGTPGVTG